MESIGELLAELKEEVGGGGAGMGLRSSVDSDAINLRAAVVAVAS